MAEIDPSKSFYQKKGTRLFLSQVKLELGKNILQAELAKVFQSFGTVEEVFVPTRSTKSYAFVRLASPEEAQRALKEIKTPHVLFKRIKPANDVAPRNKKIERLKEKAQQEIIEIEKIISQTNVICQVDRSHFERFELFLKEYAISKDYIVAGSRSKTSSKTVSLIFVHATNPGEFCGWLRGIVFIQRNLHRIFLVKESAIKGNINREVVDEALKIISTIDQGTIRLQTFPAKLSSRFLDELESGWGKLGKDAVALSPTNSSHVLGVVQLVASVPEINDGLFSLGLWETTVLPMSTPPPSPNNQLEDDICRAYWKLQEAFERYTFSLPDGTNLKVLDCGAAPGGWTQFVARNLHCQKIYSIDPGALDSTVAKIPIVDHFPMTIQNALPKLQQDKVNIDVWVSDMCVKDMEGQIDWILEARSLKIVGKATFFVLTLKCTVGHSSKTFDILVKQQMERLKPIANNLQVLHLFSNRNSERTVIGYFS